MTAPSNMPRAILLASICIVLASPVAWARVRSPSSATLGFGTDAPSHAELTDPRTGKHYKAELEVDPDVNGEAGIVNLVLLRPGSEENLLDPFGLFHGLLPNSFAALDLLHGIDKSTFGRTRAVPIRRTATKLIVHVEDAQARLLPKSFAGDTPSAEVTRLRVRVALESAPP